MCFHSRSTEFARNPLLYTASLGESYTELSKRPGHMMAAGCTWNPSFPSDTRVQPLNGGAYKVVASFRQSASIEQQLQNCEHRPTQLCVPLVLPGV